jgi:hypothetical protein
MNDLYGEIKQIHQEINKKGLMAIITPNPGEITMAPSLETMPQKITIEEIVTTTNNKIITDQITRIVIVPNPRAIL